METEFKSLTNDTPVNQILRTADTVPRGWIQFKGTNLCMDVHCRCGELTHIDGEFIYFLKCTACGTVYELNGNIELIERDPKEIDFNIHETDL